MQQIYENVVPLTTEDCGLKRYTVNYYTWAHKNMDFHLSSKIVAVYLYPPTESVESCSSFFII